MGARVCIAEAHVVRGFPPLLPTITKDKSSETTEYDLFILYS